MDFHLANKHHFSFVNNAYLKSNIKPYEIPIPLTDPRSPQQFTRSRSYDRGGPPNSRRLFLKRSGCATVASLAFASMIGLAKAEGQFSPPFTSEQLTEMIESLPPLPEPSGGFSEIPPPQESGPIYDCDAGVHKWEYKHLGEDNYAIYGENVCLGTCGQRIEVTIPIGGGIA